MVELRHRPPIHRHRLKLQPSANLFFLQIGPRREKKREEFGRLVNGARLRHLRTLRSAARRVTLLPAGVDNLLANSAPWLHRCSMLLLIKLAIALSSGLVILALL